jgi:hypothetical protein
MEMTASFETVILTYRHDLHKLQRCLQSIIQHGLGHNTEPVHIVVNDHEPCMVEIKYFIPDDPRFRVWHYTELDEWTRPKFWCKELRNWSNLLDWHSQQWFKLAASKIVSSEWYLLIDSDIVLQKSIRHTDMFRDDRACYKQTPIDFTNLTHVTQLSNAYSHWNDAINDRKYFMSDHTPFIMHTKTVKEMLPEIDQNLFHPLNDKMTLEFFLWSAYLDYRGIKDQLYFPTQPSSGYLFNACPRTLN